MKVGDGSKLLAKPNHQWLTLVRPLGYRPIVLPEDVRYLFGFHLVVRSCLAIESDAGGRPSACALASDVAGARSLE